MADRLLLTIPEACDRLNIGRTTMYGLISEGEVPMLKVGRKSLVPATALEAYVARLVSVLQSPTASSGDAAA